jgi:MFS family permease
MPALINNESKRPTSYEEKPSFLRALHNRSFFWLWLGQLVSQSGDYLLQVAVIWLVLQYTHSSAAVGLVLAVTLLPAVFFAPIAGVYVDKEDRRTILVISNLLQSLVVLALGVMYTFMALDYSVILASILILYTIAQFVRPAVLSMVPNIVGMSDIQTANSLLFITSSLNSIVGFSVGGLLFLLFGATFSIYYDFASFLFAAFAALMIDKKYGSVQSISERSNERVSFMNRFREGIAFIRKDTILLEVAVLAIIINYFGAGISALVAPYAEFNIHGNSAIYGFLLSSYSLGSIAGFFSTGKLRIRDYIGKIIFFGISIAGASLTFMGLTSNVYSSVALFATAGLALAMVNLPVSIIVQVKVPNELRGRVVTALGSLGMASQPLSAFLSGELGNSIGIGHAFESYGLAIILASFAMSIAFQQLRRVRY